jgi:hypothetical protein
MWPTPRASPNENRTTTNAPSHGNGHGKTLAGEACDLTRQWPTPSARDWKSGQASQETHDRNSRPLNEVASRSTPLLLTTEEDGPESSPPPLGSLQLNPLFVEWLMGLPLGWTDFAPLGTVLFRLRPLTPGAGSGENYSENDAAPTEAA